MKRRSKKRFSGFKLREALMMIGTNQLKEWQLDAQPKSPSTHFQQTLTKLKSHFDLSLSEAAKSVLIDIILLETIDEFDELKVWKEASLQTDTLIGTADYLIAPQGFFYQAPLLCVVEAKKDDFEQGLAQCVVEMQACRWYNQDLESIDIYGIVTNSIVWRFYKLTPQNEIYESLAYSEKQEHIFGILHWLFIQCVNNLKISERGER